MRGLRARIPSMAQLRRDAVRPLRSAIGLVGSSDLAIAYCCAVTAAAITLSFLPRATHRAVILDASTNLTNLRQHPFSVLVVSAFVVERLRSLWVLPLLALAYAAVQRWLGRTSTLVVAGIGHVGATLFVAVVLASGIAHGIFDPSVARAPDVGVSYALACLCGLLAGRVQAPWQVPYLAGICAFWVGPLILGPDYTDLGHATALSLGLALALLITRGVRAAQAEAEAAGGVVQAGEVVDVEGLASSDPVTDGPG